MKATCVFISELESADDRDKFQATLPALLSCIARALNEGDEGAAQVGGWVGRCGGNGSCVRSVATAITVPGQLLCTVCGWESGPTTNHLAAGAAAHHNPTPTALHARHPCLPARLQDALEMFIEIAEAHPRFLRKQLVEVVGAMLQVSTLDAGVCCFCHVAVCDVYGVCAAA